MKKIKATFFGTDKFASIILEALLSSSEIDIACVVTQPDRPAGRKGMLQPSLVKILAQKHELKILQPTELKRNHDLNTDLNHDINIIVDYGLIIPQNILDLPAHGSINIHPSLLPKYRGPSPIQTALLNGDNQTGITIIKMDAKMDHGPIISQNSFDIEPDDTYAVLSDELAIKASEMLIKTISDYVNGKITLKTQDEQQVSFCKMLTRESGFVDFNKTSDKIYNQYRALTPWPGLWTKLDNKRVKLLKIKLADTKAPVNKINFINNKVFIGCADNSSIEVLELQLEGKKPMQAEVFINGYKNFDKQQLNV